MRALHIVALISFAIGVAASAYFKSWPVLFIALGLALIECIPSFEIT